MDKLMTTQESANYLGLKTATLEQWRWIGCGPTFCKVGRAVRYRLSDLDSYIKSAEVVAKTTETKRVVRKATSDDKRISSIWSKK